MRFFIFRFLWHVSNDIDALIMYNQPFSHWKLVLKHFQSVQSSIYSSSSLSYDNSNSSLSLFSISSSASSSLSLSPLLLGCRRHPWHGRSHHNRPPNLAQLHLVVFIYYGEYKLCPRRLLRCRHHAQWTNIWSKMVPKDPQNRCLMRCCGPVMAIDHAKTWSCCIRL